MIDQPEKEAVVSTQSTGGVGVGAGVVVVLVVPLIEDWVLIRVDKEVGMTGIPCGAVRQVGEDQASGKTQRQMIDQPEKNEDPEISLMKMMKTTTFGNDEKNMYHFVRDCTFSPSKLVVLLKPGINVKDDKNDLYFWLKRIFSILISSKGSC
eukprot:TRINITY_DN3606_c0_g1_i1.p1 TRINITY_DN3606_c0_g1~~TRINITY_DN3606_c0_g1_i1.p1  ORF type:complete len:152 (-),score=43.82 TRINITY_DN3606_c0_g1_i1:123-578(-)